MLKSLTLELTGRCQLRCTHCYADSAPTGGHGTMTVTDWRRVIDQASDHGVETVQFIGGEPTLHPAFCALVEHALSHVAHVVIYTNLVLVTARLWELFTSRGVALSTSYHSDREDDHDAVTGRRTSHARTRSNIAQAVRRGVPVQVGIVGFDNGRHVARARADLTALGVANVRVDRLRRIGRAASDSTVPSAELCGRCGRDRLTVTPDGHVLPCPPARWVRLGNIHHDSIARCLETLAATSFTHTDTYSCTPAGDDENSNSRPPKDALPAKRLLHLASDPFRHRVGETRKS